MHLIQRSYTACKHLTEQTSFWFVNQPSTASITEQTSFWFANQPSTASITLSLHQNLCPKHFALQGKHSSLRGPNLVNI